MESFSSELKRIMNEQRLSQEKKKKKIGVDQKTVSNWLRAKSVPKYEKQQSVLGKLGISSNPVPCFSGKDDIQKILAIRNEIQKVFDTIGNSLLEIDKILKDKKF